MRPAWVDVDLDAIASNVRTLAAAVAPSALCAVVKANGYGHGSVPVAKAALDAGATWLAVALVEEGVVLRDAGIRAPILVLSEPRPVELDICPAYRLIPTIYTPAGVEAAARAAMAANGDPLPVHLKVDTGMHRVGAAPDETLALAKAIAAQPWLELAAVWTHCAVADEPGNAFTDEQMDRFDRVVAELDAAGLRPPMLHAANSAGAIAHPRTRLDLVRAGIAVYGLPPSSDLEGALPLRPAMAVKAEVTLVKRVNAGEGISYGHIHHLEHDSFIATVPIGYADGVHRRLSVVGGEVLIRGRRRPIVGVVTMDQLMVDCGLDDEVHMGDEVVLIGEQGDERITADDWGHALGTIGYEIICGIGPRVPRRYL